MLRWWIVIGLTMGVILSLGDVPAVAETSPTASDTSASTTRSVSVSTCMQVTDTPQLDAKQALLAAGRQAAVKKLLDGAVQELSKRGPLAVPRDVIERQATVLMHVKDTPVYDTSKPGQTCVNLQAYVTADDMAVFQPARITGRNVCVTSEEPATMQQEATTLAKLDVLYRYKPALIRFPPARIIPLLRAVNLTRGTQRASYCLTASGMVYPIEVQALIGDFDTPPDDMFWPVLQPPTYTNSIQMTFVLIPAGRFIMGSVAPHAKDNEQPAHSVYLSRPFYMGKYEVTQAQWQAVMSGNPSYFKGNPQAPVDSVSWHHAQRFIKRLNERESGRQYRLPTEAEWEFAARVASPTLYSFGDDAAQLRYYAWYKETAGNSPHPVGKLQPNIWGLHDMHGNVWEWVQDRYGTYPYRSVTNPQGPSSGSSRVFRGCSWSSPTLQCRTANREALPPGEYSEGYMGFRLVLEIPPSEEDGHLP
jgi:formylglycine-generating enzyme required for sulfatase activity